MGVLVICFFKGHFFFLKKKKNFFLYTVQYKTVEPYSFAMRFNILHKMQEYLYFKY
jgi:hypothetical protein